MKKLLITILIISALFIHFFKVFKNTNSTALNKKVKKGAKISLRMLLSGAIAVGIFAFAIIKFSLIRKIGYELISKDNIRLIRCVMKEILGTESVYTALGILFSCALTFTHASLLFSVITLFVVKKQLLLCYFEK